jgi:NACalpha-BTF3-like transcription factor
MAKDEQQAASQLDLEGQINKVLQARTAILQNQSKFLSSQTQMAMEMCSALDCDGLDGMKDRLNELQDGLSDAAEEAKRLEGSAQSAGTAVSSMANKSAKDGGMMKKAFSPMGGMFAGLGVGIMSSFKGATNMIGGFIASAGRITGIIGNIGKSLIMLPFSLLNNLTSLAAGAGGSVSALRQAMEDVREEFGSLANNEGKQVMDGFSSMKSQMKDMSKHGISLRKHFGPGSEGLANAMKAAAEQQKDLGDQMGVFGKEVASNAGRLEVYRKGLGLTGEAFAAMGTLASSNGKTLSETMHTVGSQAINMGKQFGIGPKVLAKSMASMAGDVANFGTMSIKQLSSLAVYTHKLGISAKELTGVIDSWDNFEDAASGASKLSQAFGMNIDAMQMMKEQDPGKRMDMLRESFQETGKSVEDLSRQELKLLSAQMGLSEEAAKKALSSDMDYDDIVAGSEDAEVKTLSQAEAMKELADSLKQVFGGGGEGPKTFSEALASGFKKGIMRGKGMRKMFRNIRKSMKQVYLFGRDLGKMFIEMFPGIQTMVKALTDLFSPSRFKKLRQDLLGAFRQLFVDLRTDPKAGVETFAAKLKEIFGKFFDSSSGPGKAFADGLKTFGKTVLLLIMSMIPMLIKGLASLIHKLADFIRDPSALTDGASGLADGLQQALAGAFENIKAVWPVLAAAFADLWEAVKPALGKLWTKMWPYILSAVILKTIVTVAANMTLGAVFGVLFKAVAGLFSGAFSKGAAKGGKDGAKSMKKKGGFITAVKNVIRNIAKLKKSDIGKAMLNVGMLVIFVGASLVALAFALKLAVDQVAQVDPTRLAIMGVILIALMFAMLPMAIAAEAMSKISLPKILGALAKTGLIVLGMGVLALIMGKIISQMEPPPMEALKGFFIIMGLILVMGLVAMLLAIPAGMLADKFGLQIAIGMAVIGAIMIAMGALGVIIGGMLSLIPNPEGVAALMQGISSIMRTTALMLPIAGALGLMAMAFPFGTAGIAILVAGFAILGTLATSMVMSLIPAMEKIAAIRVGDPASFKMVTEALLAVIQAIEGFVTAVARVMEALRPGLADLVAGNSMEDNIKAATGFVDKVLDGGILPLIEKIIAIAKSTDITESGLAAIKAIGEILKAIGSIMKSMMPDPDLIKTIAGMDSWYSSGNASKFMDKVTEYMKVAQEGAMGLIKYVAEEFFKGDLLTNLRGVDPGAAKVLAAMGPILDGIAGALDAMKPTDAQMKAVSSASAWLSGSNPAAVMREMTAYMKAMEAPIKALIETVGTQLVSILGAIKDIISEIGSLKVDPKVLAPIVELVTGVLGAMGNMMSGIGPIVKEISAQSSEFSNSNQAFGWMMKDVEDLMKTMGGSFVTMMPSITLMIKEMVKVAEGIADPDRMIKQVGAIVKAMEIVEIISEQFGGKDGGLANYAAADVASPLQAARHNMISFNNYMLKPGGPLEEFVKRLAAINIPRGSARKAEQLGTAFGALGVILDGINKFKEMAPSNATASNNDSGAMQEINQAITYMLAINYDGIGQVMEKIGGIKHVSPRKLRSRAKMAEAYGEFLGHIISAGRRDPGVDFWTRQGEVVCQTKTVLEKASGGDWDISKRTVASRQAVLEQYTSFLLELGNTMTAMRGIPNLGNDWFTMVDSQMYNLAYLAEETGFWLTDTISASMNTATTVVKAIAENFNEISNLLNTLPSIDMEATLTKFGKNMSVGHEQIKVQNKPINISVNLAITMDANDIAYNLSNAKRPQGKNTLQLSRHKNSNENAGATWAGKPMG